MSLLEGLIGAERQQYVSIPSSHYLIMYTLEIDLMHSPICGTRFSIL